MKIVKLILVFLVFAGVASCSNDGESNSNEPEVDPIIGKWSIQQELVNGEVDPLTECERQTTIEFLPNGNVRSTEFVERDTNECKMYAFTYQWQNLGNNIYRFNNGEESSDLPVIFSNNNTFTILVEDEEGSFSTTFVRD